MDGHAHLALLPDDDPDADIQRGQGRFLYFAPDEVEPWGADGSTSRTHRQRRTTMVGRLIKAVVVAAVLAAVIQSLPDIKRYLELREM